MSEILVNKLTGTSTAGSILVTGEGNSTTTNLQQGLAKAWMNLNGTGTIATRDTFNVSSVADQATGKYLMSFSSSMGNDDYSVSGGARTPGVLSGIINSPSDAASDMATGSISLYGLNVSGNPSDLSYVLTNVHGDLA